MSSSVSGAGLPSGWVHGWTIPFISTTTASASAEVLIFNTIRDHVRYRLSTSNPFGFCPSYRTGTSTISPSEFRTFVGVSSTTRETILGYFFDSHRKRAGTPWKGYRVSIGVDIGIKPSALGQGKEQGAGRIASRGRVEKRREDVGTLTMMS